MGFKRTEEEDKAAKADAAKKAAERKFKPNERKDAQRKLEGYKDKGKNKRD